MDLISAKVAALPGKIKVGLASPGMNAVTHLLQRSGVKCGELPMSLHDLDEQLKGTRLSISERIHLKNAMGRAGLLL